MITATISGSLGRDAELTHTDDGTPKLTFSVASNERGKGGEKVTVWITCSLFGTRATALAQYLNKGTKVVCIGRLRAYLGRAGDARLSMNVSEIDLMGGGQRSDEQRPTPPRSQQPAQAQLTDDGYDDCPF